ncbi:MAG: hypothetical protein H0W30_03370 [Gemmatimonadaceae bacterium]|nr:hypothetical protein [Gemmatimonadaceae bacterium]
MSDKAVLFVISLLVIMLASVMMVMWRLRKHTAQKADAERRMSTALEELNRLTARLRAEKLERDGDQARGSVNSRGVADPDVKQSVIREES